jgi:hypothetical protein
MIGQRWRRSAAAAAAGATLAALTTTLAQAATPATPSCAWGVEVAADTLNIFYPDSSAAYWVLPFTVQGGENITLAGRYADSRYSSLTVYKSGGGTFTTDGVLSSLTDYQIAPDSGSVNPWQQHAAPGGRFTVTLTADPTPGTNTLQLAPAGTPAGTTGYLVYRVYLPASGDFTTVPLPKVTIDQSGTSTPLPTCHHTAISVSGLPTTTGTDAAGTFQFARSGGDTGIFPNDDSGYLRAPIVPDGDVAVVRGKAPIAPTDNHPRPWPAPGADLRYWSMCVNLDLPQRPLVVNTLPDGQVDNGCRSDEQTTLDADGDYTYVIGAEAQRAAIQSIPGVTFLPFSTDHPTTQSAVVLRNMLPAASFAPAIQNVPRDGNPASAAAVMGPYYPVSGTCPLVTLQTNGPTACLGTP